MPTTTYQVLKDTTEHAVIKLTAAWSDSVQEDNPNRISANTLYGALNANTTPGLLSSGGSALPYYGLAVSRLWYDTTNGTTGDVELYWNADPVYNLMVVSGNGEYGVSGNWITITNAAKANNASSCNGDIGIRTRGMVANTSYTIIIELRKDNAHYQRGQLTEPAAFNYPPYGVTPQ